MSKTDETDPEMGRFEKEEALRAFLAEVAKFEASPEAKERVMETYMELIRALKDDPAAREAAGKFLMRMIDAHRQKLLT